MSELAGACNLSRVNEEQEPQAVGSWARVATSESPLRATMQSLVARCPRPVGV